MICIFYNFLLDPPLMNTMIFTSCFLFLKRFNYSVGSAQRIRETLHLKVNCRTYKRMGKKRGNYDKFAHTGLCVLCLKQNELDVIVRETCLAMLFCRCSDANL